MSDRSINQSIKQSINHSINSVSQSVSQSVNQSVGLIINLRLPLGTTCLHSGLSGSDPSGLYLREVGLRKLVNSPKKIIDWFRSRSRRNVASHWTALRVRFGVRCHIIWVTRMEVHGRRTGKMESTRYKTGTDVSNMKKRVSLRFPTP